MRSLVPLHLRGSGAVDALRFSAVHALTHRNYRGWPSISSIIIVRVHNRATVAEDAEEAAMLASLCHCMDKAPLVFCVLAAALHQPEQGIWLQRCCGLHSADQYSAQQDAVKPVSPTLKPQLAPIAASSKLCSAKQDSKPSSGSRTSPGDEQEALRRKLPSRREQQGWGGVGGGGMRVQRARPSAPHNGA